MGYRELLRVHLCCNDPESGLFSGRVWALEVGPNMEFESRFIDWGPRLRFVWGKQARIVLAGKHFPIASHRQWYGNWCWDLVEMEGRYVLDLLNWPRLRRWFDVSCAESRLFNAWEAGVIFQDSDLRLIGKYFE